jgi:hypothetical protein
VGLAAAALGAAGIGVHASSATPSRASTAASTLDKTFSCRVSQQRQISLYASVTLPPVNNQPQPGGLYLTTGVKTLTHNGTTTTVAQVSLQAVQNGLKIDTKSCSRVKHQITLKPKGLPGPPTTVTPTLFGHVQAQCGTTARVLVRLRLTTTNHLPSHAVLAIRDENPRKRPVAFFKWSPSKFSIYTAKTCG